MADAFWDDAAADPWPPPLPAGDPWPPEPVAELTDRELTARELPVPSPAVPSLAAPDRRRGGKHARRSSGHHVTPGQHARAS